MRPSLVLWDFTRNGSVTRTVGTWCREDWVLHAGHVCVVETLRCLDGETRMLGRIDYFCDAEHVSSSLGAWQQLRVFPYVRYECQSLDRVNVQALGSGGDLGPPTDDFLAQTIS
jgi:hypothetical protein